MTRLVAVAATLLTVTFALSSCVPPQNTGMSAEVVAEAHRAVPDFTSLSIHDAQFSVRSGLTTTAYPLGRGTRIQLASGRRHG